MLFKNSVSKNPLKVIVTGSPRSGTSFVAGLLSKMNLNLGQSKNIKKGDIHNPSGYFEHIKLLQISTQILKKMNHDFHFNIPHLKTGWTKDFQYEKKRILSIINNENIQLYKGNRLLILGDLYYEINPNTKWICLMRNEEATFKSRFGDPLSIEEWREITKNRYTAWYRTKASKNVLYIEYEGFKQNYSSVLESIIKFLEIPLTPQQYDNCLSFYKPRIR